MRYSGKMMGLGHEFSVASMTNLFLTLAELLLLVRVVVHFFFTASGGSFFHWVSYSTDVLLNPFRGVFVNPALFAMAVYAALGSLLMGLAVWNFGTRRGNR
jgi:flagellar biosynthesis protein FlhB